MSKPRWNCPPNWPAPPDGWTPPPGWQPDPSWPAPPDGWDFGTRRRRSTGAIVGIVVGSILGLLLLTGIIGALVGGGTTTPTAEQSTHGPSAPITQAPSAPASQPPAAPVAPPPVASESSPVATEAPSDTPTSSADAVAAACFARPAKYGDIIVREKDPTLPYAAIELGGGFAYDHRSNQCQDSIQFNLDTVSDQPGVCVQIALASDNPGYNADLRPAAPLRRVMASKGSC